ncbi:phenylalanine ammonia-lyase [Periconia macrospinosa]|uniref:Phenylalanine ammonia-lyase n=1 Tax=Periconia macrospinosa TaxID=97972 RepID=A0A2V1DHA1_9PLEO|nr:phenylalanine ammonia-lyase [Periconia macrospinosa]
MTPGCSWNLQMRQRNATRSLAMQNPVQMFLLQCNTFVTIDGNSLQLAEVVLVGKLKTEVALTDDPDVIQAIDQSVALLKNKLDHGDTVYGVNTGYGGSADVRCKPDETRKLQRALLQLLNCGVLPLDIPQNASENAHSSSLKEEWVRAAMLIRANTVARGHSCVRVSTIKALLTLLNRDIIPVIPTRGSISASGDLSPLSYVAGVLEGNPSIYCWFGTGKDRRAVPANEALAAANITPILFEPKEALGMVNGTAISAAAASMTLSSMNHLVALSQLLTAMNVEAILGTATSFAPFISQIRPHPGQTKVAATILAALSGSKLATGLPDTANTHTTPTHAHAHAHDLFQDRYSLRTVPQWLGPFIEDLSLANTQLQTELNSTTDNPIMDPSTGSIYHGGNFQAVSVTSSTEKIRAAAQAIGRMLFSQSTEMLNPATNRGLPPNLCADDPSTSFTMKGVDISMAAYLSELSFLGNPVHNHVVSAEMGNQALNSLALVSARYADSAVDILSLMCACTLYATCQALDLRVMHRVFEERLRTYLDEQIDVFLTGVLKDVVVVVPAAVLLVETAKLKIRNHVAYELEHSTTLDTDARFEKVFSGAKLVLLNEIEEAGRGLTADDTIQQLSVFTREITVAATTLYRGVRDEYVDQGGGDASRFLGRAARRLYGFVRRELGVPMHRGIVDHPTPLCVDGQEEVDGDGDGDEWRRKTVGYWVSVIHDAVRRGGLVGVVEECLREEGGKCVNGVNGVH